MGSALGGTARFALSGYVAHHFGETFPWGTLVINVTGFFNGLFGHGEAEEVSLITGFFEPLAHPLPVTNVLREDEPGVPFDPERALQNAPQREGSFFKVPPVLDQGSGA